MALTNYHIQSAAGSKIIVASVNIDSNTATVVSWQFANASGNNQIPTIYNISPSTKNVGDSAFPLTVIGSGFMSGSVVQFNGSARITTFISSSQLTAAIPSSDLRQLELTLKLTL